MASKKEYQNGGTRRRFLKGIGAGALLPLLPQWSFAASPVVKSGQHRVMSANIRVALEEDEAKGFGWSQRKETCIDIIKSYNSDIICLQEVLKVQAEDFRVAFPDFGLIGFDGPEMDAYATGYHGIAKNPIMYHKKRYELLAAGVYWLSETPLVAGSKSWDTARARHCNWIRLREKKTGREFRVLNLHLDHVAHNAKVEQANMVADESAQYQPGFAQILAGDFNARAGSEVFRGILKNGWSDSYAIVNGVADPGHTVHAFRGPAYEKASEKGKIDFIFTRGKVKAHASEIIRDERNGKYPSDHYFLIADLELSD